MKENIPYDEIALLRRTAAGDEVAFRTLFDAYKGRFFAVALKMTRSASMAEEMVQETFLKIWQSKAHLATVEKPDAYFFTILYRQVFKHFKKIALERRLLKLIAESPEFQNVTDETVLAKETSRIINEAVSKLPPRQQLIFKLSKQEGLSRDQIAERLQISPNTVRNNLADAFKFIKAYMKLATILCWLYTNSR